MLTNQKNMKILTDEFLINLTHEFNGVPTFATKAGAIGSYPITITELRLQELRRDLKQRIIAPKLTGSRVNQLYVMIVAVAFRKSIRFMLKSKEGEYALKYQTTFDVETGGEIIFFYPVNEVSATAGITLRAEEDVPDMFTVYIQP